MPGSLWCLCTPRPKSYPFLVLYSNFTASNYAAITVSNYTVITVSNYTVITVSNYALSVLHAVSPHDYLEQFEIRPPLCCWAGLCQAAFW
jgi:hypothetical protein